MYEHIVPILVFTLENISKEVMYRTIYTICVNYLKLEPGQIPRLQLRNPVVFFRKSEVMSKSAPSFHHGFWANPQQFAIFGFKQLRIRILPHVYIQICMYPTIQNQFCGYKFNKFRAGAAFKILLASIRILLMFTFRFACTTTKK